MLWIPKCCLWKLHKSYLLGFLPGFAVFTCFSLLAMLAADSIGLFLYCTVARGLMRLTPRQSATLSKWLIISFVVWTRTVAAGKLVVAAAVVSVVSAVAVAVSVVS